MTSINYLSLLKSRRNVHTFNKLVKMYNTFSHDAILNLYVHLQNKNELKITKLRKLLDSAKKYIVDTQSLTFNDLFVIWNNLSTRTKRLKFENRSMSIIDLSYFECFVAKDLALTIYETHCNKKSSNLKQYNKDHPENCRNISLDYQIEKYGKELGTQRYNEHIQKLKTISKRSINYWLTICPTEDEAKVEHSKYQSTFSLEKCILKHGLEAGTEIFNKRQDTWQNTLKSKTPQEIESFNKLKGITIENMIRKYGVEDGNTKYNNWYKTTGRTLEKYQIKYGLEEGSKRYDEYRKIMANSHVGGVSKESIKFFTKLYKWLRKNSICKRSDIYWGISGSKEYWLKRNNDIRFYDFTIKNLNIIIEYNGIAFHAKHGDFDWKSAFGANYEDSIKNDKFKKELAEFFNYQIFYVWSNENLETSLEELKRIILESSKVLV